MALPQLRAPWTITDGGLETTLVYQHGIDLPSPPSRSSTPTRVRRAAAEWLSGEAESRGRKVVLRWGCCAREEVVDLGAFRAGCRHDSHPDTPLAGCAPRTGRCGGLEIIRRYAAEPAVFQHKALLISVNRSAAETSLYEATRDAWKISLAKAKKAGVILSTRQGLIVGAFTASDWLPATIENFPGREPVPGRIGFIGTEADPSIRARYVGKRVPDHYRRPGAADPVRYTWR